MTHSALYPYGEWGAPPRGTGQPVQPLWPVSLRRAGAALSPPGALGQTAVAPGEQLGHAGTPEGRRGHGSTCRSQPSTGRRPRRTSCSNPWDRGIPALDGNLEGSPNMPKISCSLALECQIRRNASFFPGVQMGCRMVHNGSRMVFPSRKTILEAFGHLFCL